ncbi:MAG: patatin-like phospholipase family protein, partial [bacterium]|nr:patatin-like phospholipase family protein [bacterium]
MTPQHVISQLLQSDTKYPKNLELLKKIILVSYLGRLQINGLSPDDKIPLGNYLFDDERVMFDFNRLSEHKRDLFIKWLLEDHQGDKQMNHFGQVAINEYRGFSAETPLSWWGRILSWFINNVFEHWKITDLNFSFHYQITGIEMYRGDNGILVGFNQYLVPPTGTKYKAPHDSQKEPLGNTKRVFITDQLIDKLLKTNLDTLNFESINKNPHPQSIYVHDTEARLAEMYHYRTMQKFLDLDPWYVRVWNWMISLFSEKKTFPTAEKPRLESNFTLLLNDKNTQIYQRSQSNEILFIENRPNIENLVLCGGGAKIFAHVGVWKSLCEAKIKPQKYAGSSAGAIMALLCYLGYTAEEIADLFKYFKQEHLVFFDIDRNGLSDPKSLKTALDFAIARKIQELVTQYKIPYPQGKITFATLDELRVQCTGCELGHDLIVTGTNKRLRKTSYFSKIKTPHMEVSEAVKVSASFPILFRNTLIEGDEHNDGGVLNNFPTDAFFDDQSTFLESEFGNNLKVLAVQFDNGTERNTIDRVRDKVYRENFILNWIYSLLTGVKDPASGWEQDRMKLRKYAAQSIIVNVGNISSTGFSVAEETQRQLIESGYNATNDYLNVRYTKKNNNTYENKELMYSTFSSFGELLSYCCYRNNYSWFNTVYSLIENSSKPNKNALLKQAEKLRALYFSDASTGKHSDETAHLKKKQKITSLFSEEKTTTKKEETHHTLLALYPIFLKLSPDFVKTKDDKRLLELAHHSLTLNSPFSCLEHFELIKGHTHVL